MAAPRLRLDIPKMACIATWSFSFQAVQVAADELTGGGSCIDALEKGINGKLRMPGLQAPANSTWCF